MNEQDKNNSDAAGLPEIEKKNNNEGKKEIKSELELHWRSWEEREQIQPCDGPFISQGHEEGKKRLKKAEKKGT